MPAAIVPQASGSLACVTAEPTPTFAQLYETHFAFAWRSARRLGTPQASLDDVVQEVFVVAYARLGTFEGRSTVKTWLFGIIRNVVRSHLRGLRCKEPYALRAELRDEPEVLIDPAKGPLDRAAQLEAARLVDCLLEQLDEDKREVFVLAELEQMSAPEIAAALEIPLNTVYSRLRLARKDFSDAAARHRARDEWRTR